MKFSLTFLMLVFMLSCKAQKNEKFNLGFENQKDKASLSDGWDMWGEYDLKIDSISYSGNKSGKITSNGNGSFGSIVYKIPAKYAGNRIKLTGYMKIRNVEGGFAGLMLRIDGNGSSLAFDNMQNQNINGTKDWQQYSITLDYSEDADVINIAGILVGKGEAWFDDFVLTIDDNDVQTLKDIVKVIPKAELDKEFDDGSKIVLNDILPKNAANLELLGRTWGFLKYYHPNIAKGNFNWDYELFRFLPDYLKVNNKQQRDKLIIEWISSLGEIEKCTACKPTDVKSVLKPDFSWLNILDDGLKNKLLYVYNNRSQGKHYYIGMAQWVNNPIFKNENAYSNMPFPDDGFRLLALYKYWNMINYFFPYKNLLDKNWNTTLSEYLPQFIDAKTELEYEMAAIKIIGDVQDTHANLWGGADKIKEWKGLNYPPVVVKFIENQLVVTDYYNEDLKTEAGLKIGDVITKINGQTIAQIIKDKSIYYPASNNPTRLRDISGDILRSNSSTSLIEFKSGNSLASTATLKLYPADSIDIYKFYTPNKGKSYKMLADNIGYITLESIKDEDIEKIKSEFIDTKGIVIDIRNYPSTFVPFSLGSFFVSSTIPFVKFAVGSIDNPGEFVFTDDISIPSEGKTYKGKLVVLLNEISQSQAEYTAMAFRAGDNTTIIGSTTAGADGNVSNILLPGGLSTMISGIGVNYPDGKETQKIGIVPDIEIKPTIKGIIEGRDELLEKAIELINKK